MKKYKNKLYLKTKYWEENQSIKDIALDCNVSNIGDKSPSLTINEVLAEKHIY